VDGVNLGSDWGGRTYVEAIGWARDGELPILPNALWLVDGESTMLSTMSESGLPRPDDADAYALPTLERSGWVANARMDGKKTGIGFVVRTRGGERMRSCNELAAIENY
jgi:hypothetical protein